MTSRAAVAAVDMRVYPSLEAGVGSRLHIIDAAVLKRALAKLVQSALGSLF